MNKFVAALLLTSTLVAPTLAQEITEFRIGVLGGENAQDRLTSNECVRAYTEELLGVPTKIFTPADYDGVIQGLLGGTIDMAWLGAMPRPTSPIRKPLTLSWSRPTWTVRSPIIPSALHAPTPALRRWPT